MPTLGLRTYSSVNVDIPINDMGFVFQSQSGNTIIFETEEEIELASKSNDLIQAIQNSEIEVLRDGTTPISSISEAIRYIQQGTSTNQPSVFVWTPEVAGNFGPVLFTDIEQAHAAAKLASEQEVTACLASSASSRNFPLTNVSLDMTGITLGSQTRELSSFTIGANATLTNVSILRNASLEIDSLATIPLWDVNGASQKVVRLYGISFITIGNNTVPMFRLANGSQIARFRIYLYNESTINRFGTGHLVNIEQTGKRFYLSKEGRSNFASKGTVAGVVGSRFFLRTESIPDEYHVASDYPDFFGTFEDFQTTTDHIREGINNLYFTNTRAEIAANDSGYISITDTNHNALNPFLVDVDVPKILTNNAGSILDIDAPKNVSASQLWNSGTNRLGTPEEGSSWDLRVSLDVEPELSGRTITLELDIGGSQGVIDQDTSFHIKGAGELETLVFKLSYFQLGVFAANGGILRVVSNGNVEITNISFTFWRKSKNRIA